MKPHLRDAEGKPVRTGTALKVGYWLMPGIGHSARWQAVVDDLASRYSGPAFEPHLTLYFGPLLPEDTPEVLADLSNEMLGKIRLNVLGLGFSDVFTQSCFLQMEGVPQLAGVSDMLREKSFQPFDYVLAPHMSLFYGALSPGQREEIRTGVELPKYIDFEGVWAVSGPATVESSEDVLAWRMLAQAEEPL